MRMMPNIKTENIVNFSELNKKTTTTFWQFSKSTFVDRRIVTVT